MASSVPIFRSTKETTNYARLCRLLVDVGSQVLRQKFDSICPPATLNSYLSSPAVQTTLRTLKARRVLNPSQWDKLYPPVGTVSVSSRDFDITLLMVLLRNICGLTTPASGWDCLPPATDLTPEADIARIKWYRNTVYGHASHASVDDATFASCWTDIKATLVRLGGATYGPAIDLLQNAGMDPVIEEHYKNLLKQWKVDEHINDTLSKVVEKLDELKAALPQPAEKSMLSENGKLWPKYDALNLSNTIDVSDWQCIINVRSWDTPHQRQRIKKKSKSNPRESWILTGFQIPCQRNLDSEFQSFPGFQIPGELNSVLQSPGLCFPQTKISRFCNPDYLTWSERVSLSLTTKRHYEYWQLLLHCKLIRSVCDSFSQLILSSITVVSENSLFDWPCVLVNFLNSILRFWTTFELNCQAPYQSGCRQFCIYIS